MRTTAAALALLSALTCSCAGDVAPPGDAAAEGPGPVGCTPGRVEVCPCPGAPSGGSQACGGDGTFGACVCPDAATVDLAVAADGPDASPDAAGLDAVADLEVAAPVDVAPACDANLERDPMNCGRCGNVCRGGCWRGVCQSGMCPGIIAPGQGTCVRHDDCASCLSRGTSQLLVPCCINRGCAIVEPTECR